MSRERVPADAHAAAARVATFGIHPLTGLHRVGPEPYCGHVAREPIGRDVVVLPMLDRDAHAVSREAVVHHFRLEAVPAPQPVVATLGAVAHERVAAEGGLHRVRRRETEIVAEHEIVVCAALPRIHGALAGPEEEPIATVRGGVVRNDIPRTLLEEEEICGVLTAPIDTVAVAANIVVETVVHDAVAGTAIEADAEPGVELDRVVVNPQVVAAHEHQPVHSLLGAVAANLAGVHAIEIGACAETEPLALLVVMKREPVGEALVLDQAVESRLPAV